MDILTLRSGMKKASLLLALLALSTASLAECIKLDWTAPTEREDETPIQAIEKYYLYYTYEDTLLPTITIDGSAITYTTCDVQEGLHIFELTAVELDGLKELESQRSNTAEQIIPPPAPPQAPPKSTVITIRVIVLIKDDKITANAEIIE